MRRLKLKIIIPALIVLAIVVAVALFIKDMSGPAQGQISPQPASSAAVLPSKHAAKSYSGSYISFTYPGNFDITNSKMSTGLPETVFMYSNDHSGKQVAIEVTQETLANDSGVSYRLGHPALYKQQKDSMGNLVFTKNQDGSEYTAFIVHNNLVASVSLSSVFTKDLSADYNTLIKNWHWK